MAGERLLVGTAVAMVVAMIALTTVAIDKAARQPVATANAGAGGQPAAPSGPHASTAPAPTGAGSKFSTLVGGFADGASGSRFTGTSPTDVAPGDINRQDGSVGGTGAIGPSLAGTSTTDGAPGDVNRQATSASDSVDVGSLGGDAGGLGAPGPIGGGSQNASTGGAAVSDRSGATPRPPSGLQRSASGPGSSEGSAGPGSGASAASAFARLGADQQEMIASRCVDVLMRPAFYEPDLIVVCRSLGQLAVQR